VLREALKTYGNPIGLLGICCDSTEGAEGEGTAPELGKEGCQSGLHLLRELLHNHLGGHIYDKKTVRSRSSRSCLKERVGLDALR